MRAPIFLDRNAVVNISLLSVTLAAAVLVHPLLLLLPLVFHAANDFLQWRFGVNVFSADVLVQRCYQALHDFGANQSGKGIDLEFNFYNGELSKSKECAQLDKWNFMWDQLGLVPGSRLVDVGCGYGDWLCYARDRGADVLGINFTREQASYVMGVHHIEVLPINWKEVAGDPALQRRLNGQFDAVTFMGSIEHFVPPAARIMLACNRKYILVCSSSHMVYWIRSLRRDASSSHASISRASAGIFVGFSLAIRWNGRCVDSIPSETMV